MGIADILKSRTPLSSFGYGLSTAEPYVRGVLKSAPACNQDFNVTDPEAMIKEAARKLTFASPDMVVEEKATSGFKDLVPDGVKIPDNTLMVIRHVLTSTKEDRDGDVLETKGADLDPKSPLLWQHMHTMPIGKVLGEVGRTRNKLTVASAIIELGNPIAADAAKLVEADVLRFSHGFRAVDWEERKDESGNITGGFLIKQFEIMEASLVSVPSNTDAEIQAFATAKMHSDFFKAIQKSYMQGIMESKPAQVRGTAIGDDVPESAKDSYTQMTLKLGDAEVQLSSIRLEDEPMEVHLPDEVIVEEKTFTSSSSPTGGADAVVSVLVEKDCGEPEEQEEKTVIANVNITSEDIDWQKYIDAFGFNEAAKYILATGTIEELSSLKEKIEVLLKVAELDEQAERYRTLVGHGG